MERVIAPTEKKMGIGIDEISDGAVRAGVRSLLIVLGGGVPDLARPAPAGIGGKFNVATSAGMIGFIKSTS